MAPSFVWFWSNMPQVCGNFVFWKKTTVKYIQEMLVHLKEISSLLVSWAACMVMLLRNYTSGSAAEYSMTTHVGQC